MSTWHDSANSFSAALLHHFEGQDRSWLQWRLQWRGENSNKAFRNSTVSLQRTWVTKTKTTFTETTGFKHFQKQLIWWHTGAHAVTPTSNLGQWGHVICQMKALGALITVVPRKSWRHAPVIRKRALIGRNLKKSPFGWSEPRTTFYRLFFELVHDSWVISELVEWLKISPLVCSKLRFSL